MRLLRLKEQIKSKKPLLRNLESGEEKSIEIKHANLFQNLLLGVSIALILGTAIFALDLILSVVLGCLVIGFNFMWTRQFVRKLLKEGKLLPLDLLFYLTKFVISVIYTLGILFS